MLFTVIKSESIHWGGWMGSILRKGCVRPVDFKKRPCRPVEFKKRPCRMSLRPKNGRVALLILGVYTHSFGRNHVSDCLYRIYIKFPP